MTFFPVPYLLWGFISLFWKQLANVNSYDTLSYRIVFSCLTMLAYMLISNSTKRFHEEISNIFGNRKALFSMMAASLLITINWLTYIYGVSHGQATEASLGYYLMPLVSVTLSVVILKEFLSPISRVAVIIATFAVLYLILQTHRLPMVTLLLAFSFGLYGLIKKGVKVSSDVAMLLEAAFVTPIVLIYLLFFSKETLLDYTSLEIFLLAISGIVTAIPLLLFAEGVKRAPLNQVGFIQYINPTIQLAVAYFIFKEGITKTELLGFSFIWLAVIIFIAGQIIEMRKARKTK
jgi:chloramphenicol-sensitive protein RarD